MGDADGEMSFAGACAANQDEIALVVEEVAGRRRVDALVCAIR